MKKSILFFICLFSLLRCHPVEAIENNKIIANDIGVQLYELLNHPSSLKVVVDNGIIWVNAIGSEMDGVKVASIKIRAKLKKGVVVYNKENPGESIESSEGEIVLLEKDVNDYFSKEEATKGFSDLKFNFSSSGFTAVGNYTAEFLLNFIIRLSATGKLGLEKDGVYLKETSLALQGMSASDAISQMIVNKLNPLLTFKKIPFPVTFNKIIMSDSSAIMTANPKPLLSGSIWTK